jgi:polyisoprenyl-phosphate glycosyltransferase
MARSPAESAGSGVGPSRALVIPVYRNSDSIASLVATVAQLMLDVRNCEAVFVIDGSPDDSPAVLARELAATPFAARVVSLTRNFGSFAAIRAGLGVAEADQYAVMAADLQEPPQLVHEFFVALDGGECDVVLGVRSSRNADPWFARTTSALYWSWYRKHVQPEMPAGGADVFACSRQVRDALLSLDERRSSLIGQLIWLGFRRHEVAYERLPSQAARSGWTLRRRLGYMLDSVFSFTDLPIRVLVGLGVAGTIGALTATLIILGSWALGWISVPGYTPLMLAVLIALMLTLFGLGVVASYVWRTYENTKRRPAGLIRSEDRYS